MNLVCSGDGYVWQCNFEVLFVSFDEIGLVLVQIGVIWIGLICFIVGGVFEYWQEGDEQVVQGFFLKVEVVVLLGVGYNVYVEGGEVFFEVLFCVDLFQGVLFLSWL